MKTVGGSSIASWEGITQEIRESVNPTITVNFLAGGNSNILLCSPLPGEDSHFDSCFYDGLKPPTRFEIGCFLEPLYLLVIFAEG